MDFITSFVPPYLFSGFSSPDSEPEDSAGDELYASDSSDSFQVVDTPSRYADEQLEIPCIQTHRIIPDSDPHTDASITENQLHLLVRPSSRPRLQYRTALEHVGQFHGDYQSTNQQSSPDHRYSRVTPRPVDLADRVNGMYRLLALIGESGSNGYVDKLVIAQDSLQRFVNAMSPGAYASVTKVDFKTLDQHMIKPLGVYGSKDEIVRPLRSIGAIDENETHLFLARTGVLGTHSSLSSGLYILRASTADLVNERQYVIYWPEDSTWIDSATSSARRNRVTFMR